MLYCSWYMAHDRCNCYFLFWTIFCFHPPNSPKYQNLKKNEKTTCSYHLTYVYQKLQSDDVWFLKYGPQQSDWQTDWQMDWQTEKVTCRGGCPTQIFLTKRVLNVACINISPFLPALVSISFHSFVLQLRIDEITEKIKLSLMFVRHLDLYFQRLGLLVINLQSF